MVGKIVYAAALALRVGLLRSDFFFKPKACAWIRMAPPYWAITCALTPNIALWKSHSALAAVAWGGIQCVLGVDLGRWCRLIRPKISRHCGFGEGGIGGGVVWYRLQSGVGGLIGL